MEYSKAQTQGVSLHPSRLATIMRTMALLFAAVAIGLLSYFIWHLHMDSMSVPAEFIVLLIASSVTVLGHVVVLALARHSSYSQGQLLSPGLSLLLHALLLALWITGIALLASKIGDMALRASCDVSMWRTQTGVMVCRIYKALFAFLLLSALGVLGLAGLDLQTWLANGQSIKGNGGAYRDIKSGKKRWFGTAVLGGRAKKQSINGNAGYEGYSSSSQVNDSFPTLTAAALSTAQNKSLEGVDSGGSLSIADWKKIANISEKGDTSDSKTSLVES